MTLGGAWIGSDHGGDPRPACAGLGLAAGISCARPVTSETICGQTRLAVPPPTATARSSRAPAAAIVSRLCRVVGFDNAGWATALRPPLTVVTQAT